MVDAANNPSSDENLMAAYARGDASAFDVLYARHRSWLYNTLTRQLHDRARADDVFQETWLSLIRSAARYEPRARFTTWLYLLARQRLVDEWRSINPDFESHAFNTDADESSSPELQDALANPDQDPARLAERRQLVAQLDIAVRALPALQREALLLFEYADMSLDDIARTTGTSRETVKSRLRYARNRLAETLRGAPS